MTGLRLVAGALADPVADRNGRGRAECCGGDRVLDLAICLILAVTVVGLLLLAL